MVAAEPQESAASGLSCKCKALDHALHCALSLGWPLWHTPGRGGEFPPTPIHDFSQGCVKFGARIDLFRGTIADHMMNKGWSNLYEQLPSYRAHMRYHQWPTSTKRIGDAMERACGVAYAAATSGQYLPAGSSLHWVSRQQQEAWSRAWYAFQGIGFTPQVEQVDGPRSALAAMTEPTVQHVRKPAKVFSPMMRGPHRKALCSHWRDAPPLSLGESLGEKSRTARVEAASQTAPSSSAQKRKKKATHRRRRASWPRIKNDV